MLSIVFAEAALERVPREMRSAPAVVSDARRRGEEPSRILLDRSFHHSAMSRLKDSERRGRPDLVHAALLSVTGTPLYLDGEAKVYLHTPQGVVLEVAERTRVPKNYIRFRGLMEQALSGEGPGDLVSAREMSFRELARRISPGRVFGLSVRGESSDAEELAKKVVRVRDPAVVVGGFPHGHFSKEVEGSLDEVVRIDRRPLEAHVVAARVVYEIEKAGRGSMIKRSSRGSALVRSSSRSP